MDLVELLIKDHEELRKTVSELKETPAKDTETRNILFSTFVKILDRHTAEEEMFLYKRVESDRKLRPETLEGYEEHRMIGQLVKELKSLNTSDEKWVAKFEVSRELLVHHLKEEETELFPDVRKRLKEDELKLIAEKMLDSRVNSFKIG